ncbi:ArsR family transcriptional regulator [Microbacterium sp. dk485]|uniref:helix-turn-helix transcriptional regulator n=1 Tax=Microbacterium sp. dk485 TaxID=2560021 RepID=UPI001073CDD0|nr:ArsR family transcriptional regulator [Microbacterium sp. dk485]TFV81022.1 ArsR family transcriptional regulator [Microbacterium sp. dk485]
MGNAGYSAISSDSRVRILHLLLERPERTVSELCEATGLHANTVREHLQRLMDGGYVVAATEHRTTRGRPRVLYTATGEDAASSPVAQRKAREAAVRGDLFRRLWPATSTLAEEAVHQLDALVDDLEGAGFTPVVDEQALTIDLSPCPQAAAGGRDVRCTVHLGLMDGVLTSACGPLRAQRIRPSERPADCVVQLAVLE